MSTQRTTKSYLKQLVIALNLIAALITVNTSMAANRQRDVAIDKKVEDFARTLKLADIAQKLNLPTAKVKEFFNSELKRGKLTAENMNNWRGLFSELLIETRPNATDADFENTAVLSETLNAYLQVRTAKIVNDLHIAEKDLLAIHKTWSMDQKINFTKVLRKTAQIAENGRVATMDQAFEKALKEFGLLEKYRKGCKN